MALNILIGLNGLLIVMTVVIVFMFWREKGDEKKIRGQIETIKKAYEDKTAEYQTMATEAQKKTEEAMQKAQASEEEARKAEAEAEIRINKMNDDVSKKIAEVENLEQTLRKEAEAKIQEFEREQRGEVEKNMVSLVMSVTKRVLEKTLTYEEHKEIIKKSLHEMKMEE